jgi:hypothetical protein
MTVEIKCVSQRRVRLAPTVRLTWRDCLADQAASEGAGCRFTPCVAISASQALPVVMTACRCRSAHADDRSPFVILKPCAW